MNIIGINPRNNSSACLVINGKLIAAVEEKRFPGVIQNNSFPVQALKYCLEAGQVKLHDIDIIAVSYLPWHWALPSPVTLKQIALHPLRLLYKIRYHLKNRSVQHWWQTVSLPLQLPGLLGLDWDKKNMHFKVKYFDHHLCHAASAFYPSTFYKSAILIMDGYGNGKTISLAYGSETGIEPLVTVFKPHSLGQWFAAFTSFLGLRPGCDEDRVIGLAPYGDALYSDWFSQMFFRLDSGNLVIDTPLFDYYQAQAGCFPSRTRRFLGEVRDPLSPLEKHHMDIAASLQAVLEQVTLQITKNLSLRTSIKSLCLGGGLALNESLNRRILDDSDFDYLFVQPAAGNEGTALGAALNAYWSEPGNDKKREILYHNYYGPHFSNDSIHESIKKKGLKNTHYPGVTISEKVAGLVAQGKIVGWFQDRMEFGPHGLGNRSILADPRRFHLKKKINELIKDQDEFQPLPAATLIEAVPRYFEKIAGIHFGNHIVRIHPYARELIPAVVHINDMTRLYAVSREVNPQFYGLIQHFYSLTQIPVIINSTFDTANHPMVCTPEQAIECYLRTRIDALAIGEFLLAKENTMLHPPKPTRPIRLPLTLAHKKKTHRPFLKR